jgi:hypothetical protein
MNQLYRSPKVNATLPFAQKFIRALFFTAVICFTGVACSQELMFQDPGVSPGAASQQGVKLTSFNVSLVNKKITVSWGTSVEKNASHFVVQRSTDGVEFTDAGIIFTGGDGNSTVKKSYSFKDPVSTNSKSIFYYRLKMVDLDKGFEFSDVRQMKLSERDSRPE